VCLGNFSVVLREECCHDLPHKVKLIKLYKCITVFFPRMYIKRCQSTEYISKISRPKNSSLCKVSVFFTRRALQNKYFIETTFYEITT
jgi:hypothetical protein